MRVQLKDGSMIWSLLVDDLDVAPRILDLNRTKVDMAHDEALALDMVVDCRARLDEVGDHDFAERVRHWLMEAGLVLLLGLFAGAGSASAAERPLWLGDAAYYSALAASDIVSTRYAFASRPPGAVVEANPVLGQGNVLAKQVAIRAAGVAVQTAGTRWLAGHGYGKAAWALRIGIGVAQAYVVIHNVRVAHGQGH